MPFREWNFAFRESVSKFRELLRECPEILPELQEWPFRSENVFPEIGVGASQIWSVEPSSKGKGKHTASTTTYMISHRVALDACSYCHLELLEGPEPEAVMRRSCQDRFPSWSECTANAWCIRLEVAALLLACCWPAFLFRGKEGHKVAQRKCLNYCCLSRILQRTMVRTLRGTRVLSVRNKVFQRNAGHLCAWISSFRFEARFTKRQRFAWVHEAMQLSEIPMAKYLVGAEPVTAIAIVYQRQQVPKMDCEFCAMWNAF